MMKGEKGITLVALIITIIVMLILVAVTISIALNGGIFDKARNASTDTQRAQLKEAIALAKGDALMEYYARGGNPAAEPYAKAAFNPSQYLDMKDANHDGWELSGVSDFAFGPTGFDITGTINGNPLTEHVVINRATV